MFESPEGRRLMSGTTVRDVAVEDAPEVIKLEPCFITSYSHSGHDRPTEELASSAGGTVDAADYVVWREQRH